MKKKLLFALCLLSGAIFAQKPLLGPYSDVKGTIVKTYGTVDSPSNETVSGLTDENTATKYLDFASEDGMGVQIDFALPTTVNKIELVTANDYPQRDPRNFSVEGSNNGVDYTRLFEGTMQCTDIRFYSREFQIPLGSSYRSYRVVFLNPCVSNPAHYSPIQLAGMQFFGVQYINLSDENFEDKSFAVYPNPVDNVLKIDNLENKSVKTLVLSDLGGRQLMQSQGLVSEIDFSGLVKGCYLLKLELSSGDIVVKKVFKN